MSKAASLAMKLRSLCLTAMSAEYEKLAQRAGQEGWTPIRYFRLPDPGTEGSCL